MIEISINTGPADLTSLPKTFMPRGMGKFIRVTYPGGHHLWLEFDREYCGGPGTLSFDEMLDLRQVDPAEAFRLDARARQSRRAAIAAVGREPLAFLLLPLDLKLDPELRALAGVDEGAFDPPSGFIRPEALEMPLADAYCADMPRPGRRLRSQPFSTWDAAK